MRKLVLVGTLLLGTLALGQPAHAAPTLLTTTLTFAALNDNPAPVDVSITDGGVPVVLVNSNLFTFDSTLAHPPTFDIATGNPNLSAVVPEIPLSALGALTFNTVFTDTGTGTEAFTFSLFGATQTVSFPATGGSASVDLVTTTTNGPDEIKFNFVAAVPTPEVNANASLLPVALSTGLLLVLGDRRRHGDSAGPSTAGFGSCAN